MRRYLFVDQQAHDWEIDENVRNLWARARDDRAVCYIIPLLVYIIVTIRSRKLLNGQIDYYYYYYPILSFFCFIFRLTGTAKNITE